MIDTATFVDAWRTAWNSRDGSIFSELFAAEGHLHDLPFGVWVQGRADIAQLMHAWTSVCPDFSMPEAEGFGDGRRVAVRWRMTGSRADDSAGPAGAGNGRWALSLCGISIVELDVEGLILSETDAYDGRTLLSQLGLENTVA